MIARKMSFSLLFKFVEQGMGYISLFFVARYMGPKALGMLAFGLSYIALFQPFGDMGYGTAHTKRVSEGKDLGRCNGTYFTIRITLLSVMTLVVLGSVFFSKFVLDKTFISKEHELVIYILLFHNFIAGIAAMLKVTYTARKEVAKVNISNIAGKFVTVSGKVIVALSGLGVVMLAGANLIGSIVILIVAIIFFRGYPLKKPSLEYFKNYTRFAIPVIFIGFLSKYAANIDKVMIQFFWSAADVGYYSAAKQITMIFSSITLSSAALIFPTISHYHSKNNFEAIRVLSDKAERYLSMILFPVIAFTIVFSKEICSLLLGSRFMVSAPMILIILICVVYINAISSNYASQIMGTDHIKLLAKLSVLTMGLNILLNVLFIPENILGVPLLGMGAAGAAAATLTAALIAGIIYRIFAFKITRAKTNPVLLFHLSAALIMVALLYLFKLFTPVIYWYHLIIFGILGTFVYLLTLVILKEFNKKELQYFLNILKPAELKNYALDEIKGGYKDSNE